jgi:hypothetical protein
MPHTVGKSGVEIVSHHQEAGLIVCNFVFANSAYSGILQYSATYDELNL